MRACAMRGGCLRSIWKGTAPHESHAAAVTSRSRPGWQPARRARCRCRARSLSPLGRRLRRPVRWGLGLRPAPGRGPRQPPARQPRARGRRRHRARAATLPAGKAHHRHRPVGRNAGPGAQACARSGLRNVEALREMDAEATEFADASFDIAVAMFVASVVPNPQLLLAEMRRVVRPGGTILFVGHFAAKAGPRWWVERAMAPASRALGWHPDFSVDELLSSADQAGLRLCRFRRSASSPWCGWRTEPRPGRAKSSRGCPTGAVATIAIAQTGRRLFVTKNAAPKNSRQDSRRATWRQDFRAIAAHEISPTPHRSIAALDLARPTLISR